MSHNTLKDAKAIGTLLDFAEGAEFTEAEGDAELKADGVNVEAFTANILARVAARKKQARLSWQAVARAKSEDFKCRGRTEKYAGLSKEALLGLLSARPLAQVAFRNFDELKEEDLRTLLADADDLEDEGGI